MRPRLALALLLCACQSPPRTTLPNGFSPTTAVVQQLAPGSVLRTDIAAGLPDEPPWRAAAIWWREAWRQSTLFELREGAGSASATFTVQLAIDPTQRTLAAFLLHRGQEVVIGGDRFADGDLPGAIDRLAWTARTALGEQALAPVPVAACTSADAAVVLAIDDAQTMLRDGSMLNAEKLLREARRRDGSSPALLDGLAAVELMRGESATAERISREALDYEHRLSPVTELRLARTLQLARASQDPQSAARLDRELLVLGQTTSRERPFDSQALLTEAIANNFLGEFTTALPQLRTLTGRMPDQPIVSYHLGYACLGTGDAVQAVRAFEQAALRLPMPWVAVPQAMARYAAGDHDGLAALLERCLAESRTDGGLVHKILCMQAAHAILREDLDLARQTILKDLNWLLRYSTVLDLRAGEFAEQGAVLVRIGGGAQLGPVLAALQAQHPSTAIADACAFIGGLLEVQRHKQRATVVEAALARGGDNAWCELLTAFAHEVRGETLDMQNAMARAARLSSSPMTKALLARSLRAVGRADEADSLMRTLRAEMLAIHLRRPPQHPLLGPELAFAFASR